LTPRQAARAVFAPLPRHARLPMSAAAYATAPPPIRYHYATIDYATAATLIRHMTPPMIDTPAECRRH